MYLLEINQKDRHHIVGLFGEKREAISWVEALPYARKHTVYFENREFVTYTMEYEDLPMYEEIVWKKSRFPLTKYMFTPDDGVIELVIWNKLSLMDKVEGYTDGMTQVDAYAVPNTEVKDYIQVREEIREEITKYYKNLGKKVETGGVGSEDGEYLLIENGPFIHLDALTVQEWQEKSSINQFMKDLESLQDDK